MKIAKLLFILTILSVPLGQLGKIPFLPEGLNLYFLDILVVSTVIWWVLYSLLVEKKLKISKTGLAIVIFAFIALLSLLWGVQRLENSMQIIVSASYWVRWVVYAGLYFVAKSFKERDITSLFNWLIVSGVLLSLTGFIQLWLFPDWSQFSYLGWDPHKNRLLSTFFDPNFTGVYLVLIINLTLKRIFEKNRVGKVNIFALLVCVSALVLTFSRSAWLAMAVSIFVWGLLKSRRLLLVAVVLGFLAYFAVPRIQTRIAGGFDPDDSARLRFASWSQTWDIAKDNLLLGVGFNTFRYAQAERGYFDWHQPLGGHSGAGSDSSLLFVLATTGVFGLIAYLAIFALVFQKNTLLLSCLGALLVNSLFINSLFYSAVLVFLWVFLAVQK